LIDGIGDMPSVIEEKFGEDVKFIDLMPEKKWFSDVFSTVSSSPAFMLEDALETIETRSYWSRFGL
jgi:hypothetical protein